MGLLGKPSILGNPYIFKGFFDSKKNKFEAKFGQSLTSFFHFKSHISHIIEPRKTKNNWLFNRDYLQYVMV